MNLETIMKLIKDNTNCLGYVNSEKLSKIILDMDNIKDMKIYIIREPDCKVSNKEIITSMLIPIAKAKGCSYRENCDSLTVYARGIFPLRIVDRACTLFNSQLGETYKFKILTSYDIIAENRELQEIT